MGCHRIKLLIATNNPGKVREYKDLLAGLPLVLTDLSQESLDLAVEETGESFAENARRKALAYAQASGLLTLADDSGLEVDALGGEPGVCTARYAGEGANDEDRYRLLLSRLESVPWEERTARFRCVIALAEPQGEVHLVEGSCEGIIAFKPRGEHGFGYDPVFYLPEYGKTMAELIPDEKNRISHRAQATQGAWKILDKIIKK